MALQTRIARPTASVRAPSSHAPAPEFALQPSVVRGFLQAPKTLTALRHPNVSQVLAVESDETGIPFVVEELVEGESLARMTAAFPDGMPLGVAMNVVMPVIEAMAAAHKLGLVHGRLDHEHIVLTKTSGTSVPKVVHFGGSAAGAKHAQKGSERRTAPELRAGKVADVRSDVWSLGALLYETLCGEAPATGGKHVALDERAPHLPAELVQLVERCLAVDPSRRPKHAEEVRAALTAVRERLRAGAAPAQLEPRIGKAAGAVQAEPRARKPLGHDPRAGSMPARGPAAPRPALVFEDERPTAKRPVPAELAHARPKTPTAFAPEAEITFSAPVVEPEPASGFDAAFDEAFDPPPAPPSRAKASDRKAAVERAVTLPSLASAPDAPEAEIELQTGGGAADNRGFDATFDDAFADPGLAEAAASDTSFELEGAPPALPPARASMDASAVRAFGLERDADATCAGGRRTGACRCACGRRRAGADLDRGG